MKIENQVCTLEQASKLAKLGVKQSSLFYWAINSYNQEVKKITMHPDSRDIVYSAFSVAEIGVMLKELCYCQFLSGEKMWICSDCGSFETYPDDDCTAETMAQSMAIMLIHQLENKIVEIEACNERLLA